MKPAFISFGYVVHSINELFQGHLWEFIVVYDGPGAGFFRSDDVAGCGINMIWSENTRRKVNVGQRRFDLMEVLRVSRGQN
jgi:hypothetical protein